MPAMPRTLASAGWHGWRRDAAVSVAFVGLAVLLFRAAWGDPMTSWIGTLGDPPLHMWFLHWTPWAILHGHNPLFTDYANFPDGVNLMWNTFMPLTGLIASPVTFLVGIVPAYNVVITLSLAASASVTYWVLRRYVHPLGAVVGGLVFGFSPFVVAHALTHSNLVQVYLLPLYILFVDELVVRQRRSVRVLGALLGVTTAAQLYISEELLVYEALAAGLAVIVLALLHRREARPRVRYALGALAVAVVTAVVLTAPALLFQFGGPERVTGGVLQHPEIRSSDVLSFVVPTELQQAEPASARDVTADFTDSCCVDEWGSYLGAPMLVLLVVVAVVWWRRDLVKVAAIVGAVFTVLSMGPHLHVAGDVTSVPLPFRALEAIPVIGNVQPRRFMVVTWLMVAVLVAVLVDALVRAPRGSGLTFVGLGALGLSLALVVPTFDFPATATNTPAFFTTDAVDVIRRDASVLVAPFARDTSTSEPMLWQAEAGMRFKMPEGYILGPDETGRFTFLPVPGELSVAMERIQRGAVIRDLTGAQRRRMLAELEEREVEAVVVGPMRHRAAMVDFLSEVVGNRPEQIADVQVWTDVPARAR